MQFVNTVYLAVKQSRPLIQKVGLSNDIQNLVLKQPFKAFSSVSSNDKNILSTMPKKPKKPPTVFLRYIQSVRPKLVEELPNMRMTEITKVAAEMYKKMDKEELLRLTQEYEADKKLYEKELEQYNSNLTEEQKNALAALKTVEKKQKERKLIRKLARESNKPKRPPNAFFLYSLERRKADEYTGDVTEWSKKIGNEWKTLSEEEKKKYTSEVEQLLKQYNLNLAKWEASLIDTEYEQLLSKPKVSNEKSPSTKSKSKVSKNMNDSDSKFVSIENDSTQITDSKNETVISNNSGKEYNFQSSPSSFGDEKLNTDSNSKSTNPYSVNDVISKFRKSSSKFLSLIDSFLSDKSTVYVVIGVAFFSTIVVFPVYYYFCL